MKELTIFSEIISSKYFDESTAGKVTAFLERKLKTSLPILKKLGKEKYSLYGVTKKQVGFLLKDELLKALIAMNHSKKMHLSESIFIFHYKKNSEIEFAIGKIIDKSKPGNLLLISRLNDTEN